MVKKWTTFGFLILSLNLIQVKLLSQCYELVWADEFNYSGLPDSLKWTFETGGDGWGNNELQYYTENRTENARVEDSILIIEARNEDYMGSEYTSARLTTYANGHSWKYGKIEARMKLPYGQGIWPALWMLGSSYFEGVGWPACGEIDIMEMVGGIDGDNIVHSTLHWEGADGSHASYGLSFELNSGIFADEYHVFTTVWDEQYIRSYVDDEQFYVIDISAAGLEEFHNDFFIILNLAVGGNWPGNPDATTVFPQRLEIDYIRVYQGTGNFNIESKNSIYPNDSAVTFSLPYNPDYNYNWSLPEDCELLTETTDTNQISVNWRCTNGAVSCELTGNCDTYSITKNISVAEYEIEGENFYEEPGTSFTFNVPLLHQTTYNWEVPADAIITSGQGTNSVIVEWGDTEGNVELEINNQCGISNLMHRIREYGQFPYPNPDTPHEIPGWFWATEYDFGGEGSAYHDLDEENQGGGPRQDEGVDTEYNDGGSNVGWIDAGEWLKYTVEVAESKLYDVNIRVASENDGTRGPLTITSNNNESLIFSSIPNTGSWSSFETISGQIYLSEEDTEVTIDVGEGGYNIGKIKFGVPVLLNPNKAIEFSIYPNPATDIVNIIASEEVRTLIITSTTGSELLTIENINQQYFEVRTESLSQGIYFIRMVMKSGNSLVQFLIIK